MGKITGFKEFTRTKQLYRPVAERTRDWNQVMAPVPADILKEQAARCMDCGIPFCHQGCPLGNIIPDWNDLIYRDQWREAIDRLHATNNFPEFTGTLCPAPCEGSCVLDINDDPVTIKAIELAIIDHAWAQGWIAPEPPTVQTGRKVAIVGSGPAGLAAAQQLARAGHEVTVFERDDRIGGLLRYGIPEFKMEKHVLDRRLKQLEAEGVIFKPNSHVGIDLAVDTLRAHYDALLLAGGALQARNLPIPGRELQGVHFAMEYLAMQNRRCEGDRIPDEQFISAEGRNVVIIGGGDTGADCLGTVHRQGAKSVHQLDNNPRPPESRTADNPWPEWPYVFRTSAAHEEGGERLFRVATRRFIPGKNGRVGELELVEVEKVRDTGRVTINEIPDTSFTLPCDLALIAIGFSGPERGGMLEQLDVKFTDRGNVWHDKNWMTNIDGVFTAGDMQHGQSLIVWAIAEGRAAAHGIDSYLMGESDLPTPL